MHNMTRKLGAHLFVLATVLSTASACATSRTIAAETPQPATRHIEFVTGEGAMPTRLHATTELTPSRIRITLDSGWIVPRGLEWRDSLYVRVNLSQRSGLPGGLASDAMLAPWDGRVNARVVARGDSVRLTQPVAFDFPWPCDRDLTQLWPTLQVRWGRGWNYAHAPNDLLAELSRELQSRVGMVGPGC